MKFAEFHIKNFKGIEELRFNLDKSPEANIFTLVGLNESGKTTILEAINLFLSNPELGPLDIPGSKIKHREELIPINKRDNFNEDVSITVKIKLDDDDLVKINQFINKETSSTFKAVEKKAYVQFYRTWKFKDSKFIKYESKWSGFNGIPKDKRTKNKQITGKLNLSLSKFCNQLIPSILYFPNFLFDFPTKIILETKEEATAKESFYIDLIQDILFSLSNGTNVKTHLVDRILSSDSSHRNALESLIHKMELKVSEIVFDAWKSIFKDRAINSEINIGYGKDESLQPYLEFKLKAKDGIYQIYERSLGFKWFFTFLLFTQFRPFRKDSHKNIIFLFDEPASNLHSSAQIKLLESFETLTRYNKIIYTTDSQHLINPNWLESTYVVKNEGHAINDIENYNTKKTNITIQPYREFVTNHPHNTAYFQPILDVLEYSPSNLESLPSCIFLEGKNDYYTLAYFSKVIFNGKYAINMAPSTGSGNLDTLISLYIGWGKKFIVLLDSDKAGQKEKKRYIEKFGILLEESVFTLEDIDPSWKLTAFENFFQPAEKLSFQKSIYTTATKYNKTHFNRAIQECLINDKNFSFDQAILDKFDKVLFFLKNKLLVK